MKSKLKIMITAAMLILLLGCTYNPFESSQKIKTSRLTGSVVDPNGNPMEEVYVYLDNFNMQTKTDVTGVYDFVLPSPGSQSSGGGFYGEIKTYFYLANYVLKEVGINFVNGLFAQEQSHINSDGDLLDPVVMEELLTVNVQAGLLGERDTLWTIIKVTTDSSETDSQIVKNINQLFKVAVFLKANKFPLEVQDIRYFPGSGTPSVHMGLFFRYRNDWSKSLTVNFKLDSLGSNIVLSDDYSLFTHTFRLLSPSINWGYEFKLDIKNMEKGAYDVFPFLAIKQDLPEGLWKSIGVAPLVFDLEHFKIPVKYQQLGEIHIE